MTDPEGLLSLMKQAKTKGGPGKVPREDSIEDAICAMAEAHAQLALKAAQHIAAQIIENPEAALNDSITVVLDQALAAILPNISPDRRSEWSNLYRETFWRIFHGEVLPPLSHWPGQGSSS